MTFCFDGSRADPLAGTSVFTEREKLILNDLQQLEPLSQFRLVRATAVPGVYEAVMQDRVIYLSVDHERFQREKAQPQDYRYRFSGLMFDAVTGTNYTAPLQKLASLVDITDFDPKDALVRVNGNGKRTLFVLTDPLCPHCRAFEKTLKHVPDVTIFTFPVTLGGADSPSYEAALALLSQNNPASAWDRFMQETNARVPDINTRNLAKAREHLQRNERLKERVYLRGTPCSVFSDGSRLTGAVSAEKLSERFEHIQAFEKRFRPKEKNHD